MCTLRKYVKPKNKEELANWIKDYWSKLTVETCKRYVQHVHKVKEDLQNTEHFNIQTIQVQ